MDLERDLLGKFEHQTTPYRLSRTAARPTPAPGLGQHDRWVCQRVLALTDEAYAALVQSGVFH